MKHLLRLIVLVLLLNVSIVYATPFEDYGELQLNGTSIVDKNGNKFQLKV